MLLEDTDVYNSRFYGWTLAGGPACANLWAAGEHGAWAGPGWYDYGVGHRTLDYMNLNPHASLPFHYDSRYAQYSGLDVTVCADGYDPNGKDLSAYLWERPGWYDIDGSNPPQYGIGNDWIDPPQSVHTTVYPVGIALNPSGTIALNPSGTVRPVSLKYIQTGKTMGLVADVLGTLPMDRRRGLPVWNCSDGLAFVTNHGTTLSPTTTGYGNNPPIDEVILEAVGPPSLVADDQWVQVALTAERSNALTAHDIHAPTFQMRKKPLLTQIEVDVRVDANNDGAIDITDKDPPDGTAMILGVNDNDDSGTGRADCSDLIANGQTDVDNDFDDIWLKVRPLTDAMTLRLRLTKPNVRIFYPNVSANVPGCYEFLLGPESQDPVSKEYRVDLNAGQAVAGLSVADVDLLRFSARFGLNLLRVEGCRACDDDNPPDPVYLEVSVLAPDPSAPDSDPSPPKVVVAGPTKAPIYIATFHVLGSHYYGPIVNTDLPLPGDTTAFPVGTRVFAAGATGQTGNTIAHPGVHVPALPNYFYVPAGIQHPYDVKPYDTHIPPQAGDYNPPPSDEYFRDPDPNVPDVSDPLHYRYRSRTQVLVRFGGMNPGRPLVGAGVPVFVIAGDSDFHRLSDVEFNGRHSNPPQQSDVDGHIEAVNRHRHYLDVAAGVAKPRRWYTVEPDLDPVTLADVLGKYPPQQGGIDGNLLFLTHQGLYLPTVASPSLPILRMRSLAGNGTKLVKGSRYKLALLGVSAALGGNQTVTEDHPYCSITAGTMTIDPAMPDLRVRLTTGDGDEASAAMPPSTADNVVTWRVKTRFDRGIAAHLQHPSEINRSWGADPGTFFFLQPPNAVPATKPTAVDHSDGTYEHVIPLRTPQHDPPDVAVDVDDFGPAFVLLTPPWTMTSAMTASPQGVPDGVDVGHVIRGGTADLSWSLNMGGVAILAGRRAFQILGDNPTAEVARAYIDSVCNPDGHGFWFAYALCKHESEEEDTQGHPQFYCQFHLEKARSSYRDIGPNFANIHGGKRPNGGLPNGWGIGQDDPPRQIQNLNTGSPDDIWNWKYSARRLDAELRQKSADTSIIPPLAQDRDLLAATMPKYVLCQGNVFTSDGHDYIEVSKDENGVEHRTVHQNSHGGTYHDLDTMRRYRGEHRYFTMDKDGNWTFPGTKDADGCATLDEGDYPSLVMSCIE